MLTNSGENLLHWIFLARPYSSYNRGAHYSPVLWDHGQHGMVRHTFAQQQPVRCVDVHSSSVVSRHITFHSGYATRVAKLFNLGCGSVIEFDSNACGGGEMNWNGGNLAALTCGKNPPKPAARPWERPIHCTIYRYIARQILWPVIGRATRCTVVHFPVCFYESYFEMQSFCFVTLGRVVLCLQMQGDFYLFQPVV